MDTVEAAEEQTRDEEFRPIRPAERVFRRVADAQGGRGLGLRRGTPSFRTGRGGVSDGGEDGYPERSACGSDAWHLPVDLPKTDCVPGYRRAGMPLQPSRGVFIRRPRHRRRRMHRFAMREGRQGRKPTYKLRDGQLENQKGCAYGGMPSTSHRHRRRPASPPEGCTSCSWSSLCVTQGAAA